jgi:hypothetical protein
VDHTQKHAIMVMVESIEHQLKAVKALLASAGPASAAAAPTEHRTVNLTQNMHLTDEEEDDLEKMTKELVRDAAKAGQTEKFLGEVVKSLTPTMRE